MCGWVFCSVLFGLEGVMEVIIENASPSSYETIARLLLKNLQPEDAKKGQVKTKKKTKGKRNFHTTHAKTLWLHFLSLALERWSEWNESNWCNVSLPLGSSPLSLVSVAVHTMKDSKKTVRANMSAFVGVLQHRFPSLAVKVLRRAPSNFVVKEYEGDAEAGTSAVASKEESLAASSDAANANGETKSSTNKKRRRSKDHGADAGTDTAPMPKKTLKKRESSESVGRPRSRNGSGASVDTSVVGSSGLSRSEMSKAMSKMASLFDKSKPPTWKKRIAQMDLLEQIVVDLCPAEGCTAKDRSALVDKLSRNHISFGLSKQLRDLRSAVVKVACRVVATIATSLGRQFDTFAEKFVDTLMTLIVPPHPLVVRTAAGGAMDDILTCAGNNRGLPNAVPRILAWCMAKSNRKLRCRATKILLQVLDMWDASIFKEHSSQLVSTITYILADALPETRTTARECMEVLARRIPSVASSVLKDLEPRIRRTLSHLKVELEDEEEDSDDDDDEEEGETSEEENEREETVTDVASEGSAVETTREIETEPVAVMETSGTASVKEASCESVVETGDAIDVAESSDQEAAVSVPIEEVKESGVLEDGPSIMNSDAPVDVSSEDEDDIATASEGEDEEEEKAPETIDEVVEEEEVLGKMSDGRIREEPSPMLAVVEEEEALEKTNDGADEELTATVVVVEEAEKMDDGAEEELTTTVVVVEEAEKMDDDATEEATTTVVLVGEGDALEKMNDDATEDPITTAVVEDEKSSEEMDDGAHGEEPTTVGAEEEEEAPEKMDVTTEEPCTVVEEEDEVPQKMEEVTSDVDVERENAAVSFDATKAMDELEVTHAPVEIVDDFDLASDIPLDTPQKSTLSIESDIVRDDQKENSIANAYDETSPTTKVSEEDFVEEKKKMEPIAVCTTTASPVVKSPTRVNLKRKSPCVIDASESCDVESAPKRRHLSWQELLSDDNKGNLISQTQLLLKAYRQKCNRMKVIQQAYDRTLKDLNDLRAKNETMGQTIRRQSSVRIVALMLCASVAATAKKESNGMELASTAQSFSCPKLEHLLKRLNMSELLPSFYKERLTLPLLCALGEKDIEEALRDIPFGHRVLLKRIISKARDVQSRNGIDLGGNIWKEADKVAEDIFGDVSGANRLAQKEASDGKSSTPRRLAESSESQLLTSSSSDELFSSRIPIGRLFASSNCYAHIFKSIFSYLAGNSYGLLPGFRLLQRRRVMAFSESNSKGEEGRPVHVARFGPDAPHDAELTNSSGTLGGFGGGFGGGRRGPVRPSSWAFKFDAIDSVMICTKSIVREKKGGGSRVPYASCWSFRVTEMNALKQRDAGSRTYYNPGGFSPFGAGPGGRSGVVGARKVFALCGLMTKLPTNLEEFVKVCEGDGEFVAWVLSDSNVQRGPMGYGGGYRGGAPQPTVIGNLGTFKETNPASSSSNFVDAIWLEENDVISFACRNMSKAGPTGPGGEEITVAKLTLGGSTSKAPSEDSQHLNRIDVSVNGVRNGDWTVSNVKHGPMYPFVILLRKGDGLKTTRLRYPRMLD
eukprot:g2331.t1